MHAIYEHASEGASQHFSQVFYCGAGYGHVYRVALDRAPRHTVKNADRFKVSPSEYRLQVEHQA